MHTLTATEITKSFGNVSILDYVSLQCSTGEILGLFGRNGSGKSTILKILFGTLKADNIRLIIDGNTVKQEQVIPHKLIGYLPQDNFLPKGLRVRDIIPMYYKGDEQDKIFYAPRIEKMANTKAGNLSMGERRYIELLLVGHLSHPYLLLDEPFSMVEPLYKELIKEFLMAFKAKKGIILTDHYYEDVFSVTDRNLLLKNGRLITVESKRDLADHGYISQEI